MSIYRWLKRNLRHPRIDWANCVLSSLSSPADGTIGAATSVAESTMGALAAHSSGDADSLRLLGGTISIPIKIWNLTRIEMKLEEQEKLLLEARLDRCKVRSTRISSSTR